MFQVLSLVSMVSPANSWVPTRNTRLPPGAFQKLKDGKRISPSNGFNHFLSSFIMQLGEVKLSWPIDQIGRISVENLCLYIVNQLSLKIMKGS